MLPVNQLASVFAGLGTLWLDAAGHRADYSPESLDGFDNLVATNCGPSGPVPDGLFDAPHLPGGQGLGCRVVEIGCYIGEVLRRRYGGTWFKAPEEDESGRPVWAGLEFPNGVQVFPISAVARRLEDQVSMDWFVREAVAAAQEGATDEGAGPPAGLVDRPAPARSRLRKRSGGPLGDPEGN